MFRLIRLIVGLPQLKSIQNQLIVLTEGLKSKYYRHLSSKLSLLKSVQKFVGQF